MSGRAYWKQGHNEQGWDSLKVERIKVTDQKERMGKLKQWTEVTQSEMSAAEDIGQRHESVCGTGWEERRPLTNLCDDIRDCMRRNNVRIYQVPKESEKNNMAGFHCGSHPPQTAEQWCVDLMMFSLTAEYIFLSSNKRGMSHTKTYKAALQDQSFSNLLSLW